MNAIDLAFYHSGGLRDACPASGLLEQFSLRRGHRRRWIGGRFPAANPIVFFFIAILENVGYLPRAAVVMDRVLHAVGLQGKSFLPLISSYACAIPGIMATRTIENKRDRLATIFVAPL